MPSRTRSAATKSSPRASTEDQAESSHESHVKDVKTAVKKEVASAARKTRSSKQAPRNPVSGLVHGDTHKQSYILRKGEMDVVKFLDGKVSDEREQVKLETSDGELLDPSAAMVSELGERMLMLAIDPARRANDGLKNSVGQMDLSTGQVVRLWAPMKDELELTINSLTGINKHAQSSPASTFYGLEPNSFVIFDVRAKEGVVQQLELHQRSAARPIYKFSCMQTDGAGNVAAASKDGVIRLWNVDSGQTSDASTQWCSQATSQLLPGKHKEAITAIDITSAGDWIVATTDAYLIVLQTIKEKDKGAYNCFEKRPSGEPARLLLGLSERDQATVGGDAVFSRAKFSWVESSGDKEKHITAGCGRFSIVWNMRQVAGYANGTQELETFEDVRVLKSCYTMADRKDAVLDSSFSAVGRSDPIVGTKSAMFYGASDFVDLTGVSD